MFSQKCHQTYFPYNFPICFPICFPEKKKHHVIWGNRKFGQIPQMFSIFVPIYVPIKSQMSMSKIPTGPLPGRWWNRPKPLSHYAAATAATRGARGNFGGPFGSGKTCEKTWDKRGKNVGKCPGKPEKLGRDENENDYDQCLLAIWGTCWRDQVS